MCTELDHRIRGEVVDHPTVGVLTRHERLDHGDQLGPVELGHRPAAALRVATVAGSSRSIRSSILPPSSRLEHARTS